jgi:serine/threonine protein kinase
MDSLESVLNITAPQVKTLLTQFNSGDLAFFQTYFNALPTAKIESTNVKNATVNATLFVDETHIGEGGYGTVYKNRNEPYVYKVIDDYKRVENTNSLLYLKTNFKEAIIQTILQSDAAYGKYVCRLYKVYRSGNNFVFRIEPLETTLEKYIYENRFAESRDETLAKTLLKLIEILNYFYVTYGFNHKDMSLSNVMTVKAGAVAENIKLIDFGKSTVRFGDIQIGELKKRDDTVILYKIIMYYLAEKDRKPFAKIVKQPPETPIGTLSGILYAKLKAKIKLKAKTTANANKGGYRKRAISTRKNRS